MVMMNIAKSAVSGVRALLKKKGLKDAVDVTTKKAKAVTGKVKSGASKVKDVYESGVKKETIDRAKGKVLRASKKVKSAAKSTAAKATSATAAAAGVAVKKVQEKAKPIVDKAKEKGAKLKRKAERSFVNDSLVDDDGSGNLADFYGIPKSGQSGTFQNNILGGVLASKRAIKNNPKTAIAGAIGTAALTASLIKTNQPKESGYTVKRLSDGRFSTTFQDGNANAVFSSKQLSPKDIADVRKNVAVLDSIVLGDNISFLEKQEFMARLNYLSDKYGVNNITGKNLSVLIPVVGNAKEAVN